MLGIAIDLSGVMQLLKTVMEHCTDAIYIKDAERRYVFVNQRFRELIGVANKPLLIVEGKTFEEVQLALSPGGLSQKIHVVSERIRTDDLDLLKTGEVLQREVKASFSDVKQWTIEKQRLGDPGGGIYHILGVGRHKLDAQRLNSQIVKNSPSSFALKTAISR